MTFRRDDLARLVFRLREKWFRLQVTGCSHPVVAADTCNARFVCFVIRHTTTKQKPGTSAALLSTFSSTSMARVSCEMYSLDVPLAHSSSIEVWCVAFASEHPTPPRGRHEISRTTLCGIYLTPEILILDRPSCDRHRDLHPENLLLASPEDDTSIKLAGFGLAGSVRHGQLRDPWGTPGYRAPEILSGSLYGTVSGTLKP